MKLYLAAMWSLRDEMQALAKKCEALGHEVTARWLWVTHEDEARAAQMDLTDIERAEVLVLFSVGPRGTMFSGGGRCIEYGYALALGKRMALIGPRENVFHYLPSVRQFDTWADFEERFLS